MQSQSKPTRNDAPSRRNDDIPECDRCGSRGRHNATIPTPDDLYRICLNCLDDLVEWIETTGRTIDDPKLIPDGGQVQQPNEFQQHRVERSIETRSLDTGGLLYVKFRPPKFIEEFAWVLLDAAPNYGDFIDTGRETVAAEAGDPIESIDVAMREIRRGWHMDHPGLTSRATGIGQYPLGDETTVALDHYEWDDVQELATILGIKEADVVELLVATGFIMAVERDGSTPNAPGWERLVDAQERFYRFIEWRERVLGLFLDTFAEGED